MHCTYFVVECELGYRRYGSECLKCPAKTYSDTLGAPYCITCPRGYITMDSGASSADLCLGKDTIFLY